MQYTVRAFVEGKDARLVGICKTFCSMERAAYNLLREGADARRSRRYFAKDMTFGTRGGFNP